MKTDPRILGFVTDLDRERSATAHMIPELLRVLEQVKPRVRGGRLLDIGCGFGGIAQLIGNVMGLDEVKGIDLDERALAVAKGRGVQTLHVDLSHGSLPTEDRSFDLVTSFGVLDYLTFFDDIISEIYRVLKPGAFCLISLPNLASWHTRLLLLRGFQPRDIEVSNQFLVGVHPHFRRYSPTVLGHIHTVTSRGFRELMEKHGFSTISLTGGNPKTNKKMNGFLYSLEQNFARAFPNLARRFIYLGQRNLPNS